MTTTEPTVSPTDVMTAQPVSAPIRVSTPPRNPRPARRLEASTRPPASARHVRLGSARHESRTRSEQEWADGGADALDGLDTGRPLVPQPNPPLPDPTAQCCSVVRAAVEVLRGERPASHLTRWVTPQVRDQLVERARLMSAVRKDRTGRPVQVRRVRLLRLGDDVAEATVVLDDDGRVRAAAVRLEARRGVWRVAVLEIG